MLNGTLFSWILVHFSIGIYTISRYGVEPTRIKTIDSSLEKLKLKLVSPEISDPLDLEKYTVLKEEKANPKKYNVGFATRKILTNGFYEYLRSEGTDSLSNCWMISAAEL